jgi:hypothetical protein
MGGVQTAMRVWTGAMNLPQGEDHQMSAVVASNWLRPLTYPIAAVPGECRSPLQLDHIQTHAVH